MRVAVSGAANSEMPGFSAQRCQGGARVSDGVHNHGQAEGDDDQREADDNDDNDDNDGTRTLRGTEDHRVIR